MAINFPDSPTNGQSATLGGNTWTYNSTTGAWARAAAAGGGSGVTVHADQTAMLTDAGSSDEGTLHYETDTNKLYVKQASGFYLLASITNVSPTINSFSENTGGAGANNLTSGGAFSLTSGSNTVITINATDPDVGQTLTYSATVTSGTVTDVFTSPSFPVTNQSSNVFTLTPVTSSGTGGTVTIRFDASDGTNIANVSHSFEISFIIANSRYTTLLATAVDTSDNNNITDASSNNHTITVTGDAHAGTFSPYTRGGYSFQFDGSNQFASIPHNSNVAWFGQGQFTIEFWVMLNEVGTNQQFFDFRPHPYSDPAVDVYRLGSDNKVYVRANGVTRITSTTLLDTAGEWYHILVHRDSASNLKLFINGTQTGSTVTGYNQNFQAVASGNWSIGRTNSGASYVNGQITDFRVQHGEAITPPSGGPTERLTANSNTKFFYAGTPYVVDSSNNNYSITLNNGAKISPASPFDKLGYSAADHGGSVYFDGTGDYLELGTGTATAPSGDFTAEAWVYITSDAASSTVFDFGANADYGVKIFWSHTSTHFRMYTSGGTVYIYSNSQTHTINQWHHVAAVRDGGMFKFYVNGVQQGTSTASVTFTQARFDAARVGMTSHNYDPMYGYISDFRYNPTTAVYTAVDETANVPVSPLSSTGAEVHIKGTDASIIDKSQGSNLKLIGNTTGSTTQVKFANTKSMYFDGTGDYITADQIPLGTGDFTIEAYTYLDSRLTIYPGIFGNYSTFSAGSLSLIAGHQSSTVTNYQVAHNGTFPTLNAGPITYDQWVHLCLERYNGTITLYKNGSSVGSFSSTVALNGVGSNFYIGALGDAISQSYINGWIQDFRVTTGLARYTANFTPPTAPLRG